MPSILVTGASRGLGLEFARQYCEAGWRVFACCRNPEGAEKLNALIPAARGLLSVHRLDVTDPGQIDALARDLRDERIDILLNNAGVSGGNGRGSGLVGVDCEKWIAVFRVNAMAPLKMSETFLEHVERSDRRIIAALSSRMGSIADNTSGGSYLYRSSKAAVNAAMKSLSIDLRNRKVTVLVLHPGWVRTDMGGPSATLSPAQSVAGMRKVLEAAGPDLSGRFISYDGSEIPW
ncbi:MAG: SDR family oxidoreductase [bacterium]